MSIDTEALRRIAEAATPGPWGCRWEDAEEFWFGQGYWTAGRFVIGGDERDAEAKADAAHVATFDPPTVLALLDRIDHIDRLVEARNVSFAREDQPRRLHVTSPRLIAARDEAERLVSAIVNDDRHLAAEMVQASDHPEVLALIVADIAGWAITGAAKIAGDEPVDLWRRWLLHRAEASP